MTDVTVPDDLWADDDEPAISIWIYEQGQHVTTGTVIAEVMVAKSSFELVAPATGTLTRLVDAEIPLTKGQRVATIA